MASNQLPPGVVVSSDRDTISATIEVDAPAEAVFAFVARPANHAAISGDASVKDSRFGPEVLTAVGDKFGMAMKMFGVPYRMTNTVKEFDADRVIAWAHPGGHRWRWTIEPLGDDRCRVTETFDLSTAALGGAPLKLLGFPKRHQNNVAKSVANVARLVGR